MIIFTLDLDFVFVRNFLSGNNYVVSVFCHCITNLTFNSYQSTLKIKSRYSSLPFVHISSQIIIANESFILFNKIEFILFVFIKAFVYHTITTRLQFLIRYKWFYIHFYGFQYIWVKCQIHLKLQYYKL